MPPLICKVSGAVIPSIQHVVVGEVKSSLRDLVIIRSSRASYEPIGVAQRCMKTPPRILLRRTILYFVTNIEQYSSLNLIKS
jgi:hypothetical protein